MTALSDTNLDARATSSSPDQGEARAGGFPKYPAYKDSGVEWLGEVPEHWGVIPLKWLAEQITDKANESNFQIGLENIEGWTGRLVETVSEFSGDGISFRQADILFGKLRPYLAKVWLADRPGQAVGDFFVLRPRKISGEFLHKYVLTPNVIDDLNASTIGAKMPRVSWENMSALTVATPSVAEQTQIARFLDHETARIDALIEEQQRLIELLKEKRQAVISHAVTKGLDPTAPMKDSGVEWLGEVPVNWDVIPLKWLTEQVTDKATTSDFQVGLENIEGWTGRFIETDTEFSGDGIAFRQEDILFGKLRPYLAKVWLADKSGQAVGDFFVLRQRAIDSEFLHKYILTPTVIENLNASTIGAKMPRVGWEDMGALAVALPTKKEQTQIARFLDRQTVRIDALMEEANLGAKLLQERRAALISAAVTGKIDVRGWQPPGSVPAPESAQEAV